MKLFIYSRRCWIAVLLIFSGLISLFSIPSDALIIIFIGIILLFPEILYLVLSKEKIWNKWSTTNSSNAQISRANRAKNLELTPLHIDSKFRVAVFLGHGKQKKYIARLDKCSCPDFKERRTPCKHMYYLANELGLPIPSDF